MKKCSYCSKLLPDDAIFCNVCGQRVDAPQPTEEQTMTQPIDNSGYFQSVDDSTRIESPQSPTYATNDSTIPLDSPGAGHVYGNSDYANPPQPPMPPQPPTSYPGYPSSHTTTTGGGDSKRWLLWTLLGVGILALLAVGGYVAWTMFGSATVLKVIPADDSDLVITADGKEILQSAGFEVSNGNITLPNSLQGLLNRTDNEQQRIFNKILAAKCFDIDRIALVVNFTKDDVYEVYCVAPINSRNETIMLFESTLCDNERFCPEGDYDVCKSGYREFVIVNDNYCWIYTGSRHVSGGREMTTADAARRIDDILNKAQKKSIADVSFKRDVLGGSNAAAAFFDSYNICQLNGINLGDLAGNPIYNNAQVAVEARLDGMAVELVARVYDEKGSVIDLAPYSAKIDGSFAKYLTDKDMLVGAFAIDGNTPWGSIISAIEQKSGDYLSSEDRNDLLSFLTSLEGTTSFAVGADNPIAVGRGSEIPEAMMIIGVKDGKANDLIAKVANQLRSDGGNPNVSYDGSMLEIRVYNVVIKVKEQDGDILISNRRITTTGNSDLPASMFSGNVLAFVSHVDSRSQLAALGGLPGDVTQQITCDNKELKFRCEIKDVEGYAGFFDFVITKVVALSKL